MATPTTSRRAVVLGAVSMPALAAPAMASVSADSELIGKVAELQAIGVNIRQPPNVKTICFGSTRNGGPIPTELRWRPRDGELGIGNFLRTSRAMVRGRRRRGAAGKADYANEVHAKAFR